MEPKRVLVFCQSAALDSKEKDTIHTIVSWKHDVQYLLWGSSQFCQGTSQILSTLAELHSWGLVTDGGSCGFGGCNHLSTWLVEEKKFISIGFIKQYKKEKKPKPLSKVFIKGQTGAKIIFEWK